MNISRLKISFPVAIVIAAVIIAFGIVTMEMIKADKEMNQAETIQREWERRQKSIDDCISGSYNYIMSERGKACTLLGKPQNCILPTAVAIEVERLNSEYRVSCLTRYK